MQGTILTLESQLHEDGLGAPSDGLNGVICTVIVKGQLLEMFAPLHVELKRVFKLGDLKI